MVPRFHSPCLLFESLHSQTNLCPLHSLHFQLVLSLLNQFNELMELLLDLLHYLSPSPLYKGTLYWMDSTKVRHEFQVQMLTCTGLYSS